MNEDDQKRRSKTYTVLLALNIAFPALVLAALTGFQILLLIKDIRSSGWRDLAIIGIDGTALMQVVSGTYLIVAVFKIKKFYEDSKIKDQLNSRALALHAAAFGIYLLSVVSDAIGFNLVLISDHFYPVYLVSGYIWLIASFISQIALIIIFWQLGSKTVEGEGD